MFQQDHVSKDSMTEIAEMKEQVLEQFSKALENPSDLADAMETLADVAEHVMDTMIVEDPDVRTIDIREMRQMTAQFQIGAKQSQEECYVIPMQTGDSVTGVSLKIVRGKKKKGLVDIFLDGEKAGKITASFQVKSDRISGTIVTGREETAKQHIENLQKGMDCLPDPIRFAGKVTAAEFGDSSIPTRAPSSYNIRPAVDQVKPSPISLGCRGYARVFDPELLIPLGQKAALLDSWNRLSVGLYEYPV